VNPSWLPKGLSFAVPDFGVTNSPEGGPRTEENVQSSAPTERQHIATGVNPWETSHTRTKP